MEKVWDNEIQKIHLKVDGRSSKYHYVDGISAWSYQ
jgi:hypothetical protein